MKRLLLYLLIAFPSISNGQFLQIGGVVHNNLPIENGSRVVMNYQNINGKKGINCTYYIDEEGTSVFIYIPDYNIDTFKSELRQIQAKYNEWIQVAEKNNVKDFDKELPITITSPNDIWGPSNCHPTNYGIKAYFNLWNYTPRCYLNIFYSGAGIYKSYRLYLTNNDFDMILREIDHTIQAQLEYNMKQKQTNDLFH